MAADAFDTAHLLASFARYVYRHYLRVYQTLSYALQVLGVYDYMKLKDVDDKLRNKIKSNEIDLSKDKLTTSWVPTTFLPINQARQR